MKNGKIIKRGKGAQRLMSLLLALILAIGIIPLMSSETYATENYSASQPDYNGRFEVYSNYFNYYPFTLTGNRYGAYSNFMQNNIPLYMEYSTDGKNWMRSGYMVASTAGKLLPSVGYKIGGLKPNTSYQTRLYYGDYYGRRLSPYRNTGTIKTGKASKPAFKTITAKAVHVKYHKYTRPGYYYWTGYHYIWMKPVKMRYYTYDVKVTVKFKKKPGTAGIWVTGPWGEKKWLAGNKKKYTTTFKGLYPHNISVKKPRGRVKTTIKVQTGQSKAYGGYSPVKSKRVKLK